MKKYKVKYDINQDVYILSDKKIFKSKIEKIRVIEKAPINLRNGTKEEKEDSKSGICIEYLVIINKELISKAYYSVDYDWYHQRDIFPTKEKLVNAIK